MKSILMSMVCGCPACAAPGEFISARTSSTMSTWSYASDVHLEYHLQKPWPEIEADAPYLALAGDIGNPRDKSYHAFLQYCSRRFRHVVIIKGNHDQWNWDMFECSQAIRRVCARFSNVTFLDNEVVEIDGVRVFGGVLWSDVTERACKSMNDYAMIRTRGRQLTPDDTRDIHLATVNHIDYLLSSSRKPLLCITHHAPLLAMNGRFGTESPHISAFCADLSHLFRPPLVGWISGHTHSSTSAVHNGIPSESNCWG
ncbi:MAG: hypothetical protein EOO40_08330, partial [Deltaproteobacteria bacterium]